MIDQAQHFAALGPGGGGGTSGDVTQSFREGLDGTEREREVELFELYHLASDVLAVFLLAQESARRTKRWYEGSDKARR